MKYTKGPWQVCGFTLVKGPIGNTVADCRYKNGENDASLIAAAPELLEALVAASEYLDYHNIPVEIVAMVDFAIAKAKGETK